MNTNYDNEATEFQNAENEDTQFENTSGSTQETVTDTPSEEVQAKPASKTWKRAAAGAAGGLLIGGVATFLMGMKKADPDPVKENENNNHKENLSNPDWVDDQIQVATVVTDDMSFGEAFAAAREEVGPGGCFEWHGNVYGTYTAEEWNSLTAEQQTEWSDHFIWNHIDHSSSNVAQHSTHVNDASTHNTASHDQTANADDDIEVVSVNHTNPTNHVAQNEQQPVNQGNHTETVNVSQNGEPDVQILGVVHDDESGSNIGGMTVDGQEVILIDVDGNMEFDYMAADANANGQFDQEEFIDIQGSGLTVNDLGGISSPTGDMMASNDTPDYSSDSVYEG